MQRNIYNAIKEILLTVEAKPLFMERSTVLWHSGFLSPNNFDNRALWCESNHEKQERYVGWAREASGFEGETRKAHKTQFMTTRELQLLNCSGVSFLEFTRTLCENDHSTMRDHISEWVVENELDGLFAINGSSSEVLIVRPRDCLEIIEAALL